MFLPETPQEMAHPGWDELDVILVTGDATIDFPLIGVAMVGKVYWPDTSVSGLS